MKLPLTLACGLYDRTYGLRDGTVPVEGVELNFLPMMPVETFRRQGRHAEFDASEFSLSTFMVLHARGDRRFVGIPVFPSRRFRHEHVWINTRAGIRSPADLKGKRVGVQEFVQTVARAEGMPLGVGALADFSGVEFPIPVFGLLNESLGIFAPDGCPACAEGVPVTEVGY